MTKLNVKKSMLTIFITSMMIGAIGCGQEKSVKQENTLVTQTNEDSRNCVYGQEEKVIDTIKGDIPDVYFQDGKMFLITQDCVYLFDQKGEYVAELKSEGEIGLGCAARTKNGTIIVGINDGNSVCVLLI